MVRKTPGRVYSNPRRSSPNCESIHPSLSDCLHYDPVPPNLAQLDWTLKLTWLNVQVNTFNKLIDSLPAAVRTAKDGYSILLTRVTLM